MRKITVAPVLLALAMLAAVLPLRAQTFDASQFPQGVTTIDAQWRFHPGDDPAWASPSFDDSSWPLLSTGEDGRRTMNRHLTGYSWYRLRLKLPATPQQLGIDIGHINSAAEVYADGQLIGANGIMRPKPDWSDQFHANAFPLPISLNGRWVEIAVRVWKSPVASSYSGSGFLRHPIVGALPLLETAKRVAFDNAVGENLVPAIAELLKLVLGCFSLGLFLLDRRSTEYAWLALWAIGTAALFALTTAIELHQGSVTRIADWQLLYLPLYFAENLFLWGFLRARRDWLLWSIFMLDIVGAVSSNLGFHGFLTLPNGAMTWALSAVVVFILLITRLLLSLRDGSRDARLLLLPIVLTGIGVCTEAVRQAIYWAGRAHSEPSLTLWSNGVIKVDWENIFDVLFLLSVGAALILRFTRSAQEEKRLATEFASARAVQNLLVPAQLPAVAGLRLSAVYLPATEVGGDFYQIFPQPDSSTLLVIGDVSGKGLRAAMTGTLVLGALRSLAQENLSLSQILIRLNAQLAQSSDGGFVTCLCVRIGPDGVLTLANAGHLAPYCNGDEIKCDSGLPLGLTADSQYTESSLTLAPGDTLTFLSDGVVEARNATGELFGFERTRQISTQSAEQIAQAAQTYGQEDDITVLTLTFTPAPVSAGVVHA
jgi:hypothetical protein